MGINYVLIFDATVRTKGLFKENAPHHGRLILYTSSAGRCCPLLTIQHQRCIKILCPKNPEFYTLLALYCQKGQHLPALEVYNKSVSLGKNIWIYSAWGQLLQTLFSRGLLLSHILSASVVLLWRLGRALPR